MNEYLVVKNTYGQTASLTCPSNHGGFVLRITDSDGSLNVDAGPCDMLSSGRTGAEIVRAWIGEIELSTSRVDTFTEPDADGLAAAKLFLAPWRAMGYEENKGPKFEEKKGVDPVRDLQRGIQNKLEKEG